MPSGGDQATEHRGARRLGIDVEALRIVEAGELDDLLLGEARRPQRVLLAQFVVFPVARGVSLHGSVFAEAGGARQSALQSAIAWPNRLAISSSMTSDAPPPIACTRASRDMR